MIAQLMQNRRSIRKFKPEKLDHALIHELIEMAATAPSASNHQPWRFFIVENPNTIDAMSDAVQTAIDTIVTSIEPQYMENFTKYGDYFTRFNQAPTVIVPAFRELQVLSNMIDGEIAEELKRNIFTMEFNSGLVSTALAVQNLLLYAHSKGLGASCMTGPMVAMKQIKTLLEIPGAWQIACFIPIGYPDEDPPLNPRKSAQSVIRWVDHE
jgi:nitroreductase